MRVLASRHTVIEALDILASVAVYLGVTSLENLFESHRFQKAAFLLTAILAVLIVSCAAAGLPSSFLFYGLVTGVFFRAVQLFVTPMVARAGIVAVCFPLAGLVSALLRSPVSQVDRGGNLRQLVSHGGRLPTHDPSRGACRCGASERAPADSSGLLKGEIT